MKHIIILAAFIFGANAHADLLFGTFKGQDQNGAACEIEVITKYYADNTPHPLNERVTVQLEGVNWDLAHPAVVTEADSKVRFDHNFFQQIVATPVGASSLVMSIDHDVEPHPVTSFTFIDDVYRDASKTRKVVCTNLQARADSF